MIGSKVGYLAVLALGVMYSSIAACAEGEQTAASSAVEPVDAAMTRPVSDTGSSEPKGVAEQLSIVKRDLAGRLGVDVADIEVETVREVHWRSGAAGCPRPGMNYTMAIVPGLQILLRVNGKIYRYHGSRNGSPFYCPADRAEAPALGQGGDVM